MPRPSKDVPSPASKPAVARLSEHVTGRMEKPSPDEVSTGQIDTRTTGADDATGAPRSASASRSSSVLRSVNTSSTSNEGSGAPDLTGLDKSVSIPGVSVPSMPGDSRSSANALSQGSASGSTSAGKGSKDFSTIAANANFGTSGDVDSKTQKSIDVRKEQLQRVQKREVDARRKKRRRRTRWIAGIVIFVLVIGTVGGFSAFRWGVYDDAADLQGKWRVGDSNATITITDDKMKLSKSVGYNYGIDPNAKTLTYDFGQLSGNGRYRFSLDRNTLAIVDGSYTSSETLVEDIPWTWQSLWSQITTGQGASPTFGEGTMLLTRVEE